MQTPLQLNRQIRQLTKEIQLDVLSSPLLDFAFLPFPQENLEKIGALLASGEFEDALLQSTLIRRQLRSEIYSLVRAKQTISISMERVNQIGSLENASRLITNASHADILDSIENSTLSATDKNRIKNSFRNQPPRGGTAALHALFLQHHTYQHTRMQKLLSQFTYSLLTSVIAQFRMTYSRKRKKLSDIATLENVVNTGYSQLEKSYHIIREALASNDKQLFVTILPLVRGNRLLKYNYYLKRLVALDRFLLSDRSDPSENHWHLSVALTNLVKECLFFRQAVNYLHWRHDLFVKDAKFRALSGSTAEELDIKIPRAPASVTTKFTAARLQKLKQGNIVSIGGHVRSINITEQAGKAVSVVEVADAQDRIVPAVLEYIKVDSGGLAANNYVFLTGKFEQFGGRDTLRIDRLSFQEESKTNWYWRLRRVMNPIYTPYSHNLNMMFSWLPEDGGAEKQLIFDVHR